MNYNKDELEAPVWVNSDFFKLVLMNSEKCPTIEIIDFQITPATLVGDHYASIMFRAKVRYSTKQKPNECVSLIIKTQPVEEGLKKDLLKSFDFFETEIFMYTKTLPICANIIKEAGIKELLAPRILYQALEPHEVLVFEDLKELGYFMYPTNTPDKDDLKLVFAKLAQLHASSFKAVADGNTEISKLIGTGFNVPNVKEMDLFTSGMKNLLELIETMPEFEACAEKIRLFKENALINKCIESVNIPGSYNVLNHGDYHIRNMMFKGQDDKNISDVVLLDFQICHWGSPAYDILYFACIVPYEMREEMYKHYFSNFIKILENSGYNGKLPTYEQLQEELLKFRHFDLFLTSSFVPFLSMEQDKMDFDMESMLHGKQSKLFLYKHEKYIKIIRQLLPIYLEQGYFDDIINTN